MMKQVTFWSPINNPLDLSVLLTTLEPWPPFYALITVGKLQVLLTQSMVDGQLNDI